MPDFAYVAFEGATEATGTITATDKNEATSLLRANGLLVVNLRPTSSSSIFSKSFTLRKRIKLADAAWLARQVAITTASGMPLPRALAMLARQRPKEMVGQVVTDLHRRVVAGESATTAFSAHERELGPLFVAMVSSGERSGSLAPSLQKLAKMLETASRMRKAVRSALTYPAGSFLLSIGLGLGMVIFIVPIFAKLFKSLGGALPLPTQVLVGLSNILTSNAWVIPLVVIGCVAAWKTARSRHASRKRIDALFLRLPVVGSLIVKVMVARVGSTLATMMDAGVPLLDALGYCAASVNNLVFSDALLASQEDIRSGMALSASLQRYPEIPEVLPQMVAVGEESGDIGHVLSFYTQALEDDVETTVKALTSMLEPVLVVLIGSIIGSMIIALYLPMLKIITLVGHQKP